MPRMNNDQQIAMLSPFLIEVPSPVELKTFQINLGRKCNQACLHCHVDAGPARTETMALATAERCLELMSTIPTLQVLDLTGGAPELNSVFRMLVQGGRSLGLRVIDRCNLTILFEPGQEDLGTFLRDQQVEVVASLPSTTLGPTDHQRGNGVFYKSIEGLRLLNDLGYGKKLPLYLVYNPDGATLAGPQASMEHEFKSALANKYGIEFTGLYALNNLPVSRFLESLVREGKFNEYMQTLSDAFNPESLEGLMCREQVSVGYDGRLYDCDFNQMLELQLKETPTIWDFDLQKFTQRAIRTNGHCLGCTAGAGSSCSGSITKR